MHTSQYFIITTRDQQATNKDDMKRAFGIFLVLSADGSRIVWNLSVNSTRQFKGRKTAFSGASTVNLHICLFFHIIFFPTRLPEFDKTYYIDFLSHIL